MGCQQSSIATTPIIDDTSLLKKETLSAAGSSKAIATVACAYSVASTSTSTLSTTASNSPKAKTAVASTVRSLNLNITSKAKKALESQPKTPPALPPPLVDAKGRLLPEEIVKRTESSGTSTKIILGKEHEIQVEYAYWSQGGYNPEYPHKPNQDAVDVQWLACSTSNNREAWFAVFDGHGPQGDACAKYAKKKLPMLLAKHVRAARVKKHQMEQEKQEKQQKPQQEEEEEEDAGCIWSRIDKKLKKEEEEEEAMTKKKKIIKFEDDPDSRPHHHHLDHLNNKEYEACLHQSFLETNQALHRSFVVDDSRSGTTAVAVAFHGPIVTIANCGDSRAILGHAVAQAPPEKSSSKTTTAAAKEAIVAVPLTCDHTPYRLDERERVKKAGACIWSIDQMEGRVPHHDNWASQLVGDTVVNAARILEDPPRVWAKGKDFPGAAFTRSIGDAQAEEIGIIAEPELTSLELTCHDRILVIASDGVFEFLTNQQVIDICLANNQTPLHASKAVVKAAYEQWLKHETRSDDISVIVCFLKCARPQVEEEEGTTEQLLAVTRALQEKQDGATSANAGSSNSSCRRELFAHGHSLYKKYPAETPPESVAPSSSDTCESDSASSSTTKQEDEEISV